MTASRLRRYLAVLHARNMEFLRDRASLGWNILVPLFLVVGLGVIFSGDERPQFKVAVIATSGKLDPAAHPFLATRYVEFFPVPEAEAAVRKVARHRIDMLIDTGAPGRYWVNPDAPKGYVLERLLAAAGGAPLVRQEITGEAVRYVDFLLPGVLGMNMMFSGLFGVGYVVVRYRKSGFLKRLSATPLRAVEFILAQVTSRLLLILTLTSAVYAGVSALIGFRMEGSHFDLLLLAALGAASMIALGLLIAARVTSEELASGLLNVLSWPMVLLSGVWFSLEGSPGWVQAISALMPLTHFLDAARAIMLDGARLADVQGDVWLLAGMTAAFVALGAGSFRWTQD